MVQLGLLTQAEGESAHFLPINDTPLLHCAVRYLEAEPPAEAVILNGNRARIVLPAAKLLALLPQVPEAPDTTAVERNAELAMKLTGLLAPFAGERGMSEGSSDCLMRLLAEVRVLRAQQKERDAAKDPAKAPPAQQPGNSIATATENAAPEGTKQTA